MKTPKTKKTKDARTESFAAHIGAEQEMSHQRKLSAIQRKYEAEAAQRRSIEEAFEDYRACNQVIAQLEAEFVAPGPIEPLARSGASESLVAFANADWHVYETVRPHEVSGLNEYSPAIARASVERCTRACVELTQIHRAGTAIKRGVDIYLGDLMSGQLWDDQIEGNAGTPMEEALFVAQLVTERLDYLLAHSGLEIIDIVSVDGNHSRITGPKKRKANRSKHSIEWLLFQFIKRRYETLGEKRLRFTIADGIHTYLELPGFGVDRMHPNGLVWRLTHGDEGLSYQGGVGGLAVPAQRAVKQWDKGRPADLTIFGHWHTSEYLKNYLAVGSLLGYSPLSLAYRTEFERPQQAMLLVEKNLGVTGYHPIFAR